MTAFLIDCPSCSCRIPVDSETMRVVHPFVVSDTERAARLEELRDRTDRCRDLSCTCNQPPRVMATTRRLHNQELVAVCSRCNQLISRCYCRPDAS